MAGPDKDWIHALINAHFAMAKQEFRRGIATRLRNGVALQGNTPLHGFIHEFPHGEARVS
jgi:hypothetical protein